MARASVVLCLVIVVLGLSVSVHAAGRLVEKPLVLPGQRTANEVPIVDPPERIAGFFKLNRTKDAHMFYFYYESRSKGPNDPVILWMTGGPGCSSEIAIFYENGPYTLTKNLTLVDNPYGWDSNANVIYVDQPINTGFSWSDDSADDVSGEKQVADDMSQFLEEFFEARPNLANRDFYISGESYAGHYCPAVANRIYKDAELGRGPAVNLKGVAIGNGMTNPAVQYAAYADFALQNNLISQSTRDSIQWWDRPCTWGANFCSKHKWAWFCGLTMQYCQLTVFGRILMSNPGINVYDIRKECVGPLCYDFSDADKYLNSAAVKKALGVDEDAEWQECNMYVNAAFYGDFMRDFSTKLVPLLEDNIRVMIYAGDQDLICNWLGNRRWVDALEWSGSQGWSQAQDKPWKVGGKQVGEVTSFETLSFVKVYGAGHMVPMDQPAASLDMINRFMYNKNMADEDDIVSKQPAAAGAAAAAGVRQSLKLPTAETPQVAVV
jgi:carboxypeptidase C (cathepsin A)